MVENLLNKSKLTEDKGCRKRHLYDHDKIMIKFSGKMEQNSSAASMKNGSLFSDLVFVAPKYGHNGASLIFRDISENV